MTDEEGGNRVYDDLRARVDALEALVGIYFAGWRQIFEEPLQHRSGGHLLGGVSTEISSAV